MASSATNNLTEQLPALRAEFERLGKLIAAIEEFAQVSADDVSDADPVASSASAKKSAPTTRSQKEGSAAIRPDEFVGMSAPQAIQHFLALKGRGNPQGPREMAEALISGGARRDGNLDAAYENVTSALKRLKKSNVVVQVRRGEWGLASWYSSSTVRKPNGTED